MNEYKIMFSSETGDYIKIYADAFVVTNDTVTFTRLIDDGCFKPVAVFKMIDIVGFYQSF